MKVVYMPNRPISYPSNTTTFKDAYSREEMEGMIRNGNYIAADGGSQEWSFCLGCVILIEKSKRELPLACRTCFEKYCYP